MKDTWWFSREEYAGRVARVQASLRERGLDLLLAFQPESVTYLTGFFTTAYSTFQFAIVPVDRDPIVVCRDVEAYYLDRTCVCPSRVLWSDGDDTDAIAVRAIREAGGESARLGVEKEAWPLHVRRYEAISAALPRAELVDVKQMVARMRLIKSAAEVAYQRSAARIAEATMQAGVEAAKAGASERDVAAAVASAMIRGGSDRADPGPLASGERALRIHGTYSDRVLEAGDLVHLEVTPCVRHYHTRFIRPIRVGHAPTEDMALARQLIAIQDRALAAVAPGVPATVPDRIYREGIAATGAVRHYPNKTFYSVGFMLRPHGAEPLEATPRSTWCFEAGMTFHTYLIVRGLAFSETILVTHDGCERLTTYPRELLVS